MTRPLVVRFGALGDMVLMTVPIRILSERFGSPVDVLGSGPWTRPLLQGQEGVGEIYLVDHRRWPYWLSANQWSVVRGLRKRGAGPTWLFDAQNDKARWLLRRSGWRSEQLIELDRLPDITGEHFCDRWGRFALLDPPALVGQQCVAHTLSSTPQLQLSEEGREESEHWIRRLKLTNQRLILIQIGNKRTMRRGTWQRPSNTKYWPEERWAEVLRGLRAIHSEHKLLLLGVAREAELNDQVLALAQVNEAHNLARDMTVPRLMALAERATGMISVDTGPAHVAAALNCPVLTLFDSPGKCTMYAPRGRWLPGCWIVGGTDARPSMLDIAPEAVLTAWRGMRLSQAD